MTTGQFIAFNAAFGTFFSGMISLVETCLGLLNLIPVYERAKPILHALPEVSDAKTHPGEIQGAIEVVKLGFQYREGAQIIKVACACARSLPCPCVRPFPVSVAGSDDVN